MNRPKAGAGRRLLLPFALALTGTAQNCAWLDLLNHGWPDRALSVGFPASIEQDIAWALDPASGRGRAVVFHTPKTNGTEPTLRAYFSERLRPVVEQALASKTGLIGH